MSWMVSEIPEFPGYFVNTRGHVLNDKEVVLTISPNQRGIATVGLMLDGVQYRRSVAVLVATAFVDCPYEFLDKDPTPIHLDGNRLNCSAGNLMWRSLAVAMAYHKDISQGISNEWTDPILLVETEEVFTTPRDAAMTYGIPEMDIYRSIARIRNQERTRPYGFTFTWA